MENEDRLGRVQELMARPAVAYSICLTLYLAYWGIPIVTAIRYLNGDIHFNRSGQRTELIVADMITATLVVTIGLSLVWLIRPDTIKGVLPALDTVTMKSDLNSFTTILSSIILSIAVMIAVFGNSSGHPSVDTGSDSAISFALMTVIHAGMAGPVEEIALVFVPVILLRYSGQDWSRIILLCVAFRLAFHVFYGWHTIGLTIWALAVILTFRKTERIFPAIVAHSLFNLTNSVVVNFVPLQYAYFAAIAYVVYIAAALIASSLLSLSKKPVIPELGRDSKYTLRD